ncbi:MAG: hypothetical protein F6K35_27090 [Okeania sp. SIO2H7]|nr:hypothetical protein [Okeania sp. SIO2H7]
MGHQWKKPRPATIAWVSFCPGQPKASVDRSQQGRLLARERYNRGELLKTNPIVNC